MKQALIAVCLLFAAAGPLLAQCAMCQGASAAGSDGGSVYNRSTLFMLCVPYLLLAGVAGYVVYAFRRARPANPSNPDLSSRIDPQDSTMTSGDSERERG
jgi:hypothetical protein